MGGVPRERLGIASGLLALSRTLGQTAGVPLLGAIFAALSLSKASLPPSTNVTTAPAEALVYCLQGTFLVAALILGAAAILTIVVWKMESSQARVS